MGPGLDRGVDQLGDYPDCFRGAPAVDLATATSALLRLQALAQDFPEIQEVEVNPFILAEKGKRSVAVDGRIRVGDA